jgi:hypothetical protein
VLATILPRIRPDTRFMANRDSVRASRNARLLVSVDPDGRRIVRSRQSRRLADNRSSISQMAGLLVVFPAGEVSHFQWRKVLSPTRNGARPSRRMIEIAARRGSGTSNRAGVRRGLEQLSVSRRRNGASTVAHAHFWPGKLFNKRNAAWKCASGSPIESDKLLSIDTP